MSETVTIALPYNGGRYYFTPDTNLQPMLDFKLWGAGGGAGGADSHSGANGAGGNYVSGRATFVTGDLIEVYVGGGGRGGHTGSGSGGGQGGGSLEDYAGGAGGYPGPSGSSGGGGGGGGPSVLKIADSIIAIAGGGGGGGGGGNHGYGNPATGTTRSDNPFNETGYYSIGGTNGAWSNLLNNLSVWDGSGSYSWKVYIPQTGLYYVDGSIDDYGALFIDDVLILNIGGYSSVYSTSVTLTAGWHHVKMNATNTGGPGALAARIKSASNVVVWTSRYPNVSIGNGSHGQNHGGDGGGGGAGGGGYIGGSGGSAGNGDVGGYGGENGQNFLLGKFGAENDPGEHGNYRTPGGSNVSEYVSPYGQGGIANSGNGQNGYVLITFYNSTRMSIKKDDIFNLVKPYVKVDGVFKKCQTVWAKVDGQWTRVLSDAAVTFSSDLTLWEEGLPPTSSPSSNGGGGKIICTKLYELGLLPTDIYEADQLFGAKLVAERPDVYYGYVSWAKTVVDWMNGDGPNILPWLSDDEGREVLRNWSIKWSTDIATPWAEEMAYKMGVKPQGSIAGKMISFVGETMCKAIGAWNRVFGKDDSSSTGFVSGWALVMTFAMFKGISLFGKLIDKCLKKLP